MADKRAELHADALLRYKAAEEFEREDRLFMAEDLAFAAGDQWPEDIKHERQSQDRPCLTFNRLPAFIEQVIGDARQNKPGIKVHPVDSGADPDTAEIYEGLIRNIEAQSRATIAYITALTHAVTGSRGGWRVVTEYATDDSFEQDIRIKRITNPFAISWDPGATEYDKSDANWCFVTELQTLESFEANYPDESPTEWPTSTRQQRFADGWVSEKHVRVSEYWVKEPITTTLSLIDDGYGGKIVTDEQLPKDFPKEHLFSQRKVKSHKVVRYVMSGDTILEGPEEFPSRWIPIIPCFGPEEFVGDRVRYRSLIRYAKDPMRMYNFWQTTIAEKISLAPKSPWLVTAAMIKGLESFWNRASTENRAYLPYNIDKESPGSRPTRQEPAYVNSAEIQQSQQAIEDIKATMGIFDASLGAGGNETSGRAIIARQREGDTATFAWVDNLASSIEHTGRILIDMIPRIYDTERVVRVLGEDDSVELVEINHVVGNELVNDLTVGKYDVHISVGPSYHTKRIEAAESLMAFVQALPQAGAVAGDLIAKNMDWPGADEIGERLKKLLPPGIAENDDEDGPEAENAMLKQQIEQMAQEMEMIVQQAEGMAQELKKFDDADLQVKAADAEAKHAKAYRDMQEGEAQEIENDLIRRGLIDPWENSPTSNAN